MSFCPNCGSEVIPTDKFCPQCGSSVGTVSKPQHQPTPQVSTTSQWQGSTQSRDQLRYPVSHPSTSSYQPIFPDTLQEANKHANYSIICGIIGLLLFGIILGVAALFYGKKARDADPSNNKATLGIILGVIDIIAWAYMMFFVF